MWNKPSFKHGTQGPVVADIEKTADPTASPLGALTMAIAPPWDRKGTVPRCKMGEALQ